MPITYPIDFPATPGIRKLTWDHDSAVGVDESPFNYSQTVYAWDGKLRRATFELPQMELANAKLWQSWAMKLNGREKTFYAKDASFARAPSGNVVDSYTGGLVNGDSQSSASLITDGWANSVTDLFKEGDWISIDDRLYTILEDVDSDGSGNATLTVWPYPASPADNTAIKVGSEARGKFRLEAWPSWSMDYTRLMSGFTFTAREVL